MIKANRKQILIVDDHPLVVECLTGVLNKQRDLNVCAVAADATRARRLVGRLHPDLVILDLSLPDDSGLNLIRHVRAQRDAPEVLVLTVHEDAALARRALQAGARGYVVKTEPIPRIVAAVRAVLSGETFVSDALAQSLLEGLAADSLEVLSDRELRIFELFGQGLTTAAIADRLNISIKTVQTHRARMMRKLRLSDAAALCRAAVLWQAQRNLPNTRGRCMRFSLTAKPCSG